MSLIIELRPDTEAGLAAIAAKQGLSLAQYVGRLLEDRSRDPGPDLLPAAERAAIWRTPPRDYPVRHRYPTTRLAVRASYDAHGMSVLVDTNVLLRRSQPEHPSYAVAVESVARLMESGEPVYVTSQNIAEFWNVATRPIKSNGMGFSLAETFPQVKDIERTLVLLPDAPATYAEWKRLVVQHAVTGTKVHDTRLVAAMLVHRVGRILTFNTSDFTRYDIEPLHIRSPSLRVFEQALLRRVIQDPGSGQIAAPPCGKRPSQASRRQSPDLSSCVSRDVPWVAVAGGAVLHAIDALISRRPTRYNTAVWP